MENVVLVIPALRVCLKNQLMQSNSLSSLRRGRTPCLPDLITGDPGFITGDHRGIAPTS